MFQYLPEDILLIIIIKTVNLTELFISCKLFTKYYDKFRARLLTAALTRETNLIKPESRASLEIGQRVYSDINYKVIDKNLAIEVNQFGKRIDDLVYNISRRQQKIFIEGQRCKPGIITFGPIIKSSDSYYLKYRWDPNNVGFKDLTLNMIVIIEYFGYQHEYVAAETNASGNFTGTGGLLRLIDGGKHKKIDKSNISAPKEMKIFNHFGNWYIGFGKIIKIGGYLK